MYRPTSSWSPFENQKLQPSAEKHLQFYQSFSSALFPFGSVAVFRFVLHQFWRSLLLGAYGISAFSQSRRQICRQLFKVFLSITLLAFVSGCSLVFVHCSLRGVLLLKLQSDSRQTGSYLLAAILSACVLLCVGSIALFNVVFRVNLLRISLTYYPICL